MAKSPVNTKASSKKIAQTILIKKNQFIPVFPENCGLTEKVVQGYEYPFYHPALNYQDDHLLLKLLHTHNPNSLLIPDELIGKELDIKLNFTQDEQVLHGLILTVKYVKPISLIKLDVDDFNNNNVLELAFKVLNTEVIK